MNVGDLFINLGIKGSEKTVGALSGVTKGLGEAKSMSIEAKAAILGAVYAFERLMSNSGRAGTDLVNFAALTGLSVRELQKWQYAALQAGESSEDFEGSLKGVQQAVSNMLLNKSAPEYIGMIARNVKDFDPTRLRDTFYLMGKLQEAAQNMPADLGTTMLRSFGLSDQAIAAMRRNAFNPGALKEAENHIYGDKEINALNKANIAWQNLGRTIEMAFGHFNARHGAQLVGDLTKITTAVVHLAEALDKVATQYGLFEKFGKLIHFTADALESKPGSWAGEKHIERKIPGVGAAEDFIWNMLKGDKESPSPAPALPIGGANSGSSGNTVDVKQTVIFQGPQDAPKKTAEALKKAVGDYVKQSAVKVQGS